MKYKVVNEDWDMDFSRKKLKKYVLFESRDIEKCKKYAKDNNIDQNRIVTSKGRMAIGDWYGAYDNDIGWEYD